MSSSRFKTCNPPEPTGPYGSTVNITAGRRNLIVGATVLSITAVAGVIAFAIVHDDQPTISQSEAAKVDAACVADASEASRYESEPDAFTATYVACLDDELAMTAAEVEDIVSPITELPACDDLWTEDVQWPTRDDTYGWQCRYGTTTEERFKAETAVCFDDGVDGWLVIGPDDFYIFRGGSVGYDAVVSDGFRQTARTGYTELDIARELCSGT